MSFLLLFLLAFNDQAFSEENVTTSSNSSSPIPDVDSGNKPFLLSTNILPINYRLEVIPLLFPVDDVNSPYHNVSNFSAPGKVWIKVKCLEKVANITLHAHEDVQIDAKKIEVRNFVTNETVGVSNVTRDNDTDFLVLHLAHEIGDAAGKEVELYMIYIEFTTRVADDRLNGMYLDYYVDPVSRTKRYLSTTLFAPNHARKAFPCFDDLSFKATFNISIGRKSNSGYTSISNMPIELTKPILELDGWVWDVFQETVPLPTYIVAMITSDFGNRSVKHGKTEVRLHAPEYLLERTKKVRGTPNFSGMNKITNPFLLQDPLLFIEDVLERFELLTALGEYPLPKLDVVALPHFFFNAMENMGAMTFKYPVILNVENTTTVSELLRVAAVAGHEVAHQHFGNMLTPNSWDNVWLKESFSDLFSSIFLSQKMNDRHYEHFVNNELQIALNFDGSAGTHPLENRVKSAAAVGDIYTTIPYRKGCSVWFMTLNFLGPSAFQQGLQALFKAKKFSNISPNDVYDALEKSQVEKNVLAAQGLENVTVSEILNTWTQKSGYPVIRLRRNGNTLILNQEKFENGLLAELDATNGTISNLTEPENGTDTKSNETYWWIPVFIEKSDLTSDLLTVGRQNIVHWLRPEGNETEIVVNSTAEGAPLIASGIGYYRILYSDEELHSILTGLTKQYYQSGRVSAYQHSQISLEKFTFLSPVARSQLLDDYFTFTFARYEEVPVSLLFHIMSLMLPYESEHVVWNTVLTNIRKPFQLLQTTDHFAALGKYMTRLLKPLRNFMQSQLPIVSSSSCSRSSTLIQKLRLIQLDSFVFSWLCEMDPEECTGISMNAVKKFMESNATISTIPADEQSTVYCSAVKSSSGNDLESVWSFFENQYFEELYPVQRDRYVKALSCTTSREHLRRLLSWTTYETIDFHDVDRVTLIKNIIANPEGRKLILDFLDENFEALYKSNSVANPVTEAIKALVDYTNSNEMLQEMENFINKHSVAMEKKKKFLEKQVKNAKLNILWTKSFGQLIEDSANHHLETTFASRSSCDREDDQDFDDYILQLTSWKKSEL